MFTLGYRVIGSSIGFSMRGFVRGRGAIPAPGDWESRMDRFFAVNLKGFDATGLAVEGRFFIDSDWREAGTGAGARSFGWTGSIDFWNSSSIGFYRIGYKK